MQLLSNFQLFLLDFDGLLVNTEDLHYRAYKKMCSDRGFDFDLSFPEYCKVAHYSAFGIEDKVYNKLPGLKEMEPDWKVLYAEKRQAYVYLLNKAPVELMPGVDSFLKLLEKEDIKRCVVTHSPLTHINQIREQNPILSTIPSWITREDYNHPKPDPECYQQAISRFAKKGEKVVGFEDSFRGITALMGTEANPVWVSAIDYPEIPQLQKQGIQHYSSFTELLTN